MKTKKVNSPSVKFRIELRKLAREVLEIIADISVAEDNGTPYYDDIEEKLQGLLWDIKQVERKYNENKRRKTSI